MKIISKWKDYYDYLSVVYGIDPIIVYDRRGDIIKHEFNSTDRYDRIKLHVCNRMYTIYEYKGKFYHLYKDILKLDKLLKKSGYSTVLSYWRGEPDIWSRKENWWGKGNVESTLNKKERQPVLLQNIYGIHVPLLSSYNFHKVLPADDIYQKVCAFIGWMKDNTEIPNKQTNLEKLDSHGFDRKKSFRHRK